MTAIGQAILIVCSVLVVADGLLTWWGTRKGLRELNPFLRRVLKESGPIGLAATRIAGIGLLFLLFSMLSVGIWELFGSTFSLILGIVVLNDLRRLRSERRLVRSDQCGERRAH